jgi:hypothetical protein
MISLIHTHARTDYQRVDVIVTSSDFLIFSNIIYNEAVLYFDDAELTVEDSGNYTCEVRGSNSAVLASVVHFLFVRGQLRLLCRMHVVRRDVASADYEPMLLRNEPRRVGVWRRHSALSLSVNQPHR